MNIPPGMLAQYATFKEFANLITTHTDICSIAQIPLGIEGRETKSSQKNSVIDIPISIPL